MRKIILIVLSCICLNTYAQDISVSGQVMDTSENRPLQNAVISLIRPSDSILVNFTRTNKEGRFGFTKIRSSTYLILITYPGYADYVENIRDTQSLQINLGSIPLTKKSQLLEAVIVRQQISAIRMKGDTLEYNADSFAVRQGATVDELLKRLPGIQVNRNGEITAQGQKVNKVLVDGEEFFSEDPAVVIKNLQADAVKEVQVFDKKSEQSDFTGIDDGERSKTINLTLKADRKKGYFAKGTLGGGTGKSFDNDLMLNAFKGNRKVAAYGIMSNTGRSGLDWQDNDRFGRGNNLEYDEENGYYFLSNSDEEFTQEINTDEGLPAAWAAGFHFSDKWNQDRKKLNTNYRFLKKNMNATGTTISRYILPDTQYFNTQSRNAFTTRTGQELGGTYDIKFDSSSSMKINVSGNMIQGDNISRMESAALNADSGQVNKNTRLLTSHTSKNNFYASVLWRKKFKRKGRTLSLNFDQQSKDQLMEGFLNSNTDYFNSTGEVFMQEKLDQKKKNTQNTLGVKTNIVYTEPLSKTLFFSVNYGYNFLKTEAFRNSFNKGSFEYDKRDSLLSNDYRFNYNVHTAGADIKLNKKKLMMLFGSGINYSQFKQTDLQKDSLRSYSFTNFFPKVFIRLNPAPQRQFGFRYNGQNNPPRLHQLQPVRENTDPLNIQLGNPGLRQEFVHNLNMYFNDYKIVTNRSIYLYVFSSITKNAISTSTVVDAGGKTTFQPINVNGNFNTGFSGGYGWRTKKLDIYMGIGGQMNYNRMASKVNNLDNINNYRTYSIYLRADKFKNDKYSYSINPSVGYTFSTSTLRPDVVTSYVTSETQVSAWTKLPWKMEIGSSASINLREKTDVFDRNRNSIKWDANISRKFLKNNKMELKLSVYDLLNQNIGFNRIANSNIISENSYTTLQRYWMLSLQYSLSKGP